MNAMEKAAWTQLAVTAIALALAACLVPWLGNAATGAFGLLGLLPVSMWWVRRRGDAVVTDERDQQIEYQSTFLGVHAAWMLTFLTLIVLVLWSSQANGGVVPTWWLTWLVWTQFAVCYLVKGVVAVVTCRRQLRAAQA